MMRNGSLPTGRLLDESETRVLVLRLAARKGMMPLPVLMARRSWFARLRCWIWRSTTRDLAESLVPAGR